MSDIALHLVCSRATACDYYAFDGVSVFFLQCGRVGIFTCSGDIPGRCNSFHSILQGHDSIFLTWVSKLQGCIVKSGTPPACFPLLLQGPGVAGGGRVKFFLQISMTRFLSRWCRRARRPAKRLGLQRRCGDLCPYFETSTLTSVLGTHKKSPGE